MTDDILPAVKLKSIPEGQTIKFKTVQIVKEVITKTAKSGNTFLRVEVSDRDSGFIFNVFENSVCFNVFTSSTPGEVVYLEGTTTYFNGNFSPTISTARIMSDKEINEGNWLIQLKNCSKYSQESMISELNNLINSIQDIKLRETVKTTFDKIGPKFYSQAAGISMHHAYENGLLEHTVHVAQAGRLLLKLYTFIDYDLAMAGMLLHDIGKVLEYSEDKVIKKTEIGILQGHLVIGYRFVRENGLKVGLDPMILERLEHILLSHHDIPEYGAAVRPATPEAFFVAFTDNFDAKMGMIESLLSSTPESELFSDRHPGLESKILVTPVVHKI